MTLTLAQAIYGERDRGHRLLGASPTFPEADRLAGRMDMQGSPPPHTAWQPYFSGFAWNGYYVFARTMPDPRAERAGMVFSRALAVPEAVAGELANITGLFSLLTGRGDERDQIDDIEYRDGEAPPPGSPGLVHAMLREGQDPVVWPGEAGFDHALASLWAALWPAARLGLSFRIAFSPTDVANDPPSLVTTPASLVTRWSSFRIVRTDAEEQRDDAAEAFLLNRDAPAELKRAIAAFGPRMPKISEVRRVVDLVATQAAGGALADLIDGLRLVCDLAPEREVGGDIKTGLVDRAVAAMASAAAADVRMARNLDLAPIGTAEHFWNAMAGWAQHYLWSIGDAKSVATILEEACSTKPVAAWRDAILKGVGQALAKPTGSLGVNLWKALAVEPALLGALIKQTRDGKRRLEAALLLAPPQQITAEPAKAISAEALRADLSAVHALCCAASLTPLASIRRHLSEARADARTLALAARDASGEERVVAALEHDDDLTLMLGAQAAAETPSLLRKIVMVEPRWRDLWTAAILIDPAAAGGPSRPSQAVSALLDGLVDGTIAADDLLDALSTTALADLTSYPRHAEVWPKLVEPTRSRFLDTTADAWLAALEGGNEMACDDVLASKVASPAKLDPVLARLTADVDAGCRLFRALPQLAEPQFGRWLDAVLRRGAALARAEAEALGRLVAARSWDGTAARIADAITDNKRADLRPAVDYILDLLGVFRRYWLDENFSHTPMPVKWQILQDVALELYGYGPGENQLWQRAGGKESDIPQTKTGAEAWRKVVTDAQKGKGDVNIASLIKTMADDYPHHRTVSKLRWDSAFQASR